MLVAPTVNLMEQAQALLGSLPAVIAIIAVSTFLTLMVTGRVTQALLDKKKGERDHA